VVECFWIKVVLVNAEGIVVLVIWFEQSML
jgi:hypothetical protein